jgi:hypothetical protein
LVVDDDLFDALSSEPQATTPTPMLAAAITAINRCM